MKLLISSLLILLVTAIITTLVLRQPGYVLFAIGFYTIEMSITAFVVLLLIGFIGYYFVVRAIFRLLDLPQRLSRVRQSQQQQRAQRDLIDAFIAAAQGNWARSERLAFQSAAVSASPVIHYLSAARAAQQQENYEQRDRYLFQAFQIEAGNDLAVELTQAELELAQEGPEKTLPRLEQLYEREPQNRYLLKLLSACYYELKSWDRLTALEAALRKAGLYTPAQLQEFKQLACEQQMDQVVPHHNHKLLRQLWRRLPAKLRYQEKLVRHYTRHLCQLGQPVSAERILRSALNKSWSEMLAAEYGRVQLQDPTIQLTHGEVWLKHHGNSVALILSLARICRHAKLWGKARSYFELSLSFKPLPETFYELAKLLEQVGDTDSAQECFRKGLRLAVQGTTDPLRTQAQKYAAKHRETMLSEVLPREKALLAFP